MTDSILRQDQRDMDFVNLFELPEKSPIEIGALKWKFIHLFTISLKFSVGLIFLMGVLCRLDFFGSSLQARFFCGSSLQARFLCGSSLQA